MGAFSGPRTEAVLDFVLEKDGLQETGAKQIIATDDDPPRLLPKKVDVASNVAIHGFAEDEDGAFENSNDEALLWRVAAWRKLLGTAIRLPRKRTGRGLPAHHRCPWYDDIEGVHRFDGSLRVSEPPI